MLHPVNIEKNLKENIAYSIFRKSITKKRGQTYMSKQRVAQKSFLVCTDCKESRREGSSDFGPQDATDISPAYIFASLRQRKEKTSVNIYPKQSKHGRRRSIFFFFLCHRQQWRHSANILIKLVASPLLVSFVHSWGSFRKGRSPPNQCSG